MDIIEFENYFPFWNNLSNIEKSLIKNNSTTIKYKKGDNVHNASEHCLGMLFLKSGQLRTYMLSNDGKEVTLYRLFSNDTCVLSASCILSEVTFDVFIDAEEDSETIVINSQVIKQLMETNIYVQAYVYKITTERFSDVMWAMEQILFMSFDKRLAVFLVNEYSKDNSGYIKLTHEQIAKYMGSAREVVSRMLKYFASEGIVELSRGGVKIINKSKLTQIAMSN